MEYKDYYKILGVPKDADEKTIKRAFRQLARKYHPDVNPDDPQAEAKFKEINEAYQVLGDPQKRAKYDSLRESYGRWQSSGGQPGGFDWSQWMAGAPGGVRVEYSGSASDVFSEFFQQIFGGDPFGGAGSQRVGGIGLDELFGTPGRSRRAARGRDLETQIEISLDEAYHGTTRILSVNGRRLQVKIPRGARTGTRVRVAGQGEARDGGQGDLYLNVVVQENPRFKREGNDLYVDAQISLYTAVLGGEVQVPTMTGSVTLKINPGTQPGQLIRLRGRGMPDLHNPDEYGDLYVRIGVDIPTDLSARERALFRELASIRGQNFER
ncbi:MAG: DnaJ C-terminal domain-containing protein [Anaerolineae bacterium]